MKRPTMGALLGAAVVLALLGVQPSGMGAAQGLEVGGSAAVTALAGNTFTYQGFLTYNNQPAKASTILYFRCTPTRRAPNG